MRIPIGSFSLEFPDTWNDRTVHTFVAPKVINPRHSPHLRMKSGFRENIVISRERVRRGITAHDFLQQQLDELKRRLLGYRFLFEEESQLGGYPAHTVAYQFALRGEKLKINQMRVAMLIGNQMTVFTCTAAAPVFEAKRHVFLKILSSLEMQKP